MIREELERALTLAIKKAGFPTTPFVVEEPKDATNGDYATNAALIIAKQAGKNPREVAQKIVETFSHDSVQGVSVAGPGFINLALSIDALLGASKKKASPKTFAKKKFNIEFISANPTGDLHIGHGRGAFYGDMLANVLEECGAKVTREYYINDSRDSKQIKDLGMTALGKGESYKTEKLEKLLEGFKAKGNESEAGSALAELILKEQKKFVEKKLGIKFDDWYSEDKEIRASGSGEKMLTELKNRGLSYAKEGATWLKTSEHGDEEDRVLVRSDGTPSYFLSDIAYHADKFSRGYDSVVNVWGADHHGHVKRLEAVKKMLDWKGEFRVFITQLVSLKEDGVSKKMSKRAGTVILLEDLVDEFGLDTVRWFFGERALSTHMEFDMALAHEKSEKNPVYYVQYAHARMASVARKMKGLSGDKTKLADVLKEPSARALAMKVLRLPEVLEKIATSYEVHRLPTYAYELASDFSAFYRDVRIIDGEKYNKGALELLSITQKTLAKTLSLLGISAPEQM